MIIIKCDECNQEFKINKQDIKFKTIDEMLTTVEYFECTECNHKYIISCEDSYIAKEKRRYKKLISSNCNGAKAVKCLSNMKAHSDILKEKIKDKLDIIE